MDIQAFNKELAKKIAIANRHEKSNEIEAAISSWLAVTDMVLAASKSPKIENDYRNMLIKKIEQIVTHIKQLKVKLALPRVEEPEITSMPQTIDMAHDSVKEDEYMDTNDLVNDNELNALPDGFSEIAPTKDFKIITPHREIDASLANEAKKAVLLDDDRESSNSGASSHDIIIEQPKDGRVLICFACGAENPPFSKTCKSCNTKLT
ncbi:MAG: zinc ribbon domain-containing protein [Candidatus Lokiarchaeota archaeon]|nr:zinc ribbon domain-containing protein [Candidatus Lokiarchaeota archaeon]